MRVSSSAVRLTFFAFLAVFLASLAACQRPPDCFREDVFCAALVTDTLGIKDHGANQEAWAGLQAAKSTGLADHVAYIESVDTRDYNKNIRYFADKGYDVIVTTGAGMHDETLRGADLKPDSVFIGINQTHGEARPNRVSITYTEDRMGFLAGVLAARLTKTGVVAGVCETSGIDAMWRYCEGFRAGVRHADENPKVLIAHRDDG
ncbi:MAG TPA: BMP family ABC transporter substrate-binding protein, partial [Anaerolineales bacterium]|nr:BMP family ABC transporter substrate-binding protein [Anaerolineales bacterium]